MVIIHLGRNNAGPELLIEAESHLRKYIEVCGLIHSSNIAESHKLINLEVQKLTIPTYNSRISAAFSIFTLPLSLLKIHKFLKSIQATAAIFVMPHMWDPIIQPYLKFIMRLKIITWIHDGVPHPGENALVKNFITKANLFCANQIVTFSNLVYELIETRTHKKIVKLTLPVNAFRITEKFEKHQVLFIGRINKYKGLDRLAKAWEIVQKINPSLKLTIAGSGIISNSKLKSGDIKNITLEIRMLSSLEFEKFLQQAQLVVLPYDEASQSGIIIKAVENRIPYVITPISGLQNQAEIHGGATIAKNMTDEAFADAILHSVAKGPKIPWKSRVENTWDYQMRFLAENLETL